MAPVVPDRRLSSALPHERSREPHPLRPPEVEPRVLERWLASGRFHPEPKGPPEENYSIAIPPPNVTGALHMGHALNGSVQDALIRPGAHARPAARSGSSAPTTPASRPRRWSSG